MALILAAVTPHGHTGPLVNRLLYGHDTLPHNTSKDRPHGQACKETARSAQVPHNILGRANQLWRRDHPRESYGGSYKAIDPKLHFDQELGLIMSTAIASHLLRARNKISALKPTFQTVNSRTNYNTDSTASLTTMSSLPVIHKTDTDWQLEDPHAELLSQETTVNNPVCGAGNLSQDTLREHFSSTGTQTFNM